MSVVLYSNDIEPVEAYLAQTICFERMAMYQPIIDLIKELQFDSIIDALNQVVFARGNASNSEMIMEIEDTFVKYLTQIISEYDVMVETENLPLLSQIVASLMYLENHENHEYIINVCQSDIDDHFEKLYTLFNFIKDMDEREYYDVVKIVPLTLFTRLVEVHRSKQEASVEDSLDLPNLDNAEMLKRVVAKDSSLMVAAMVTNHTIVPNTPPEILISRIAPNFYSYLPANALDLVREYLAILLCSTLTVEQIPQWFKDNIEQYVSNPETCEQAKSHVVEVMLEFANG